ncbi:hypothetical protein PPTG_23640 [Phytophthora nicotianae INRA-310]|uniref:Uncharacterized protein n=1 Tax=Phytophthora nicotianae (strain INRA-310) TaxID=761204 RepID=W2PW03_PHYN3|nr:hypothetical protein PPTG_23640 [Phytophthora nicotianae INRA-310]ETN04200.1 hypothetical protein PPTG_23640 [Phytophthora nicotianae INRA-310]
MAKPKSRTAPHFAESRGDSTFVKIKKKTKKIRGRGLMGAGVQPLEGATRRKGQTYNLNDIQKLATPSAYIYLLDPRIISKTSDLYQFQADKNLAELKSLMKDLIIKESPYQERPTVWASDSKPYDTKSVSTQTDAVAGGHLLIA